MAHRETDLYGPVKQLLEGQGYVVKGEVGPLDVMAVRGDESPVAVELKLSFSLSLVHQGIARQALTDHVYLAVPAGKRRDDRRNATLCRRLGLGLVRVHLPGGPCEVLCDPAPYRPRRFPARTARLLREFQRLQGDPNTGGGTRRGLVTAYRQDALRIAHALRDGPRRGADIARETGVVHATRMLRDNHYGWFEKFARGVYQLGEKGRAAIIES
ncbi:DUF2161 domain-containing phosphodiesterase [Palleronia abyssalis]|uniref:Uncharacterized protein n=1 Tax=Palleronia abyssalis TaxID=1501240 RepID=A0A2R8C0D3_9RHOB|nr:DUF2161 family putative PD-(D/E)XK-type phosphodiesterase [Palleronia abyssalis]SPJ25881.1 hypothetical protein PAA8504_03733 [Palleronia abyssalis]